MSPGHWASGPARSGPRCTSLNWSRIGQIGTNDSLHSVDSSGGSTWGSIVNAVASYAETNLKQVIVTGRDDIERGYGTSASSAIAWAKGFGGKASYYYDDYGSADGCPESSHNNSPGCENSWTQWDVS